MAKITKKYLEDIVDGEVWGPDDDEDEDYNQGFYDGMAYLADQILEEFFPDRSREE